MGNKDLYTGRAMPFTNGGKGHERNTRSDQAFMNEKKKTLAVQFNLPSQSQWLALEYE